MNTAVATQTNQTLAKRDTIEALLERPGYAKRFQEVLKDRAPQFMSSILSIGRNMPDVEPKSLIGSAMKAAVLDLPIEPGLGFAWMVPYKSGGVKYAQFQMGFKGYIQLALRTGRYERMNARPVNKEALCGYDEVGEPRIDWNKIDETKDAVGYAFGFKLIGGFTKVCYWTREKVVAHAQKYSQAFRAGGSTPWKTEFDKMALKTVIANELSDWGILSVEWQRARAVDQGIVRDIDAEIEFIDAAPVADRQIEDHKPELTPFQQSQQATPTPAPQPIPDVQQSVPPADPPAAKTIAQTVAQAEAKRRGRPPGALNKPKVEKFTPKEAAELSKEGNIVAPSAIEYPEGTGPANYDSDGELIPQAAPVKEEEPEKEAPEADNDLAAMGLAPEPEAEAPKPPPMQFSPKEGESTNESFRRALQYLGELGDANGDESKQVTPAQLLAFCVKNNLARAGQKLTDLTTEKLFNLAKNFEILRSKLQAFPK